MISERFNPSDPPEKQGSGNQVAVHQPAQLRAPSNPIRLAKAWQVFWKTLLWSYGNLIACVGASRHLLLWLAALGCKRSLCNGLLLDRLANSSHMLLNSDHLPGREAPQRSAPEGSADRGRPLTWLCCLLLVPVKGASRESTLDRPLAWPQAAVVTARGGAGSRLLTSAAAATSAVEAHRQACIPPTRNRAPESRVPSSRPAALAM